MRYRPRPRWTDVFGVHTWRRGIRDDSTGADLADSVRQALIALAECDVENPALAASGLMNPHVARVRSSTDPFGLVYARADSDE